MSCITHALKTFSFMCAGFCLACTPHPAESPTYSQPEYSHMGIGGRVTDQNGQPVSGAYVYAYRNAKSNLRGPADFEARVDDQGRFLLDLVEGQYYLVARLRQTGADAGPPKPGDAWALPSFNPVTVNTSELVNIDFVLQSVTQPMLMREGTLTSGDTGFTGQLVDAQNQPLAGAFVIAYTDPDFRRMPQATSPAVGPDGLFKLFVPQEGQWCLAARTRTRGQPSIGEPFGLLDGKQGSCRKVQNGEILDVGAIRLVPYRP